MHKPKPWADIIQELQREHGTSTRRLSQFADVSRTHLGCFLRGKRKINIEALERVLAVFGYELDAFFIRKEGGPCR